jgi:hypothetical protein
VPTKELGLSAAEQATLDKLMAKANASAVHAPALRIGEPYIALVNLSVPRRGETFTNSAGQKDVPQTDLVYAGDTVYLTDDEAARFSRCDPNRDGRRIPVVRKVSEGGELARVHPSMLSGPMFRPAAPAPGMPPEYPRPDPPGSSQVIESSPVPESAPIDAVDITPSASAAPAAAGADQDIVAAAKLAMGRK